MAPPLALPFEDTLCAKGMALIAGASNLVEYARRDTIIKQNGRVAHLAYIQSGMVKITREMRKGKSIILRIAQPGYFVGLPSFFSGQTYHFSVHALEPTAIRFVDQQVFSQLIAEGGRFAQRVAEQLAYDDLFHINRLSSLLYKQLPGRVADMILYFSEDIYQSPIFTLPLTRQELAELAGTTKESLIRTLSEFRNDRIIDMNRNQVSILSMSIVRTLSRLG